MYILKNYFQALQGYILKLIVKIKLLTTKCKHTFEDDVRCDDAF